MRLLDDTLVVILSDHGEGLGEHGLFDHGESLYNTELDVPLLILMPLREPDRAGCAPVCQPSRLAGNHR